LDHGIEENNKRKEIKFVVFEVGHQRVRGYIFNCSLKSELCERMVQKIAGARSAKLFLLFVILAPDAFELLQPIEPNFLRCYFFKTQLLDFDVVWTIFTRDCRVTLHLN